MFVVITERQYKVPVYRSSKEDRFQPRWAVTEKITVSGPFPKRNTADRAAASAMANPSCLSARIYSEATILSACKFNRYSNDSERIIDPGSNQPMSWAILNARRLLGVPDSQD